MQVIEAVHDILRLNEFSSILLCLVNLCGRNWSIQNVMSYLRTITFKIVQLVLCVEGAAKTEHQELQAVNGDLTVEEESAL